MNMHMIPGFDVYKRRAYYFTVFVNAPTLLHMRRRNFVPCGNVLPGDNFHFRIALEVYYSVSRFGIARKRNTVIQYIYMYGADRFHMSIITRTALVDP